MTTNGYARPDMIVSTEWVAQNLHDTDKFRLVESNEDVLVYSSGHIPNAVHIDWIADLNDPIRRDYIGKEEFEALMSRSGITNDTTVIFYGDKNNWWAAYALWVFQLFGHKNVRIMDGGRQKWIAEGRELTREVPQFGPTDYKAQPRADRTIRAFRDDVLQHIEQNKPLVDVRSPPEYRGELLHMPGSPQEGALRGGHIRGAVNVPWSKAVNEDGTFKSP
ncbi:MAG TPA: sulfurtransferase, partial [Aggregatilineales bacterium]|nr:sulfurtransferase [Aggregatilineales bacterium]